tara:strand:- start:1005 stop:1427 length:423 start_codon:yes stop_codon:yes gene_type:complete
MNLYIGSDHAGYQHKKTIIKYLKSKKIKIIDMGPETEESVDYPEYAHKVCEKIKEKNKGILICGSGNGISMAANKHKNIRAAICWNKKIAELARKHNDANILSIPARFINKKETIEILNVFLKTEFEGGRHQRRINKINT